MNTSNIFKKAHELTKSAIQSGDSYQVTFSLALKMVYSKMSKSLLVGHRPYQRSKNGKLYFEAVVGIAEEGDCIIYPHKKYIKIQKKNLIIIGNKLIKHKDQPSRRRSARRDYIEIHAGYAASTYKVTGCGSEYMNYHAERVQRFYLEEK